MKRVDKMMRKNRDPFQEIVRRCSSFISLFKKFSGSENYWKKRYESGGNSGEGSYDKFSEFKADVLNRFVKDNKVESVIEYGCGDGNQLRLSDYSSYIGFDVSPQAVSHCKDIFSTDKNKVFKLIQDYQNERATLTLSLDVIYHLVEDTVYFDYMKRLFESSDKYVIIYSTNTDKKNFLQAPHVRHRNFSNWIEKHQSNWNLIECIENSLAPVNSDKKDFYANFYIFEKQ